MQHLKKECDNVAMKSLYIPKLTILALNIYCRECFKNVIMYQ